MIHLTRNEGDEWLDLEDEETAGVEHVEAGWRVLIVDDEEDVHRATTFALKDQVILGKPLTFLHAHSSADARLILSSVPDIAVILLDVVMESEDSGLRFVRVIREELMMTETRIILRTGQPGYAPELAAIRDYDINDYKTKSELTLTRLVTTLTTAIRCFEQIRMISNSRRGLNLIVRSAADLFARRALEAFSEGVLTQLSALLGLRPDGLICAQNGSPLEPTQREDWYIVGAAGQYGHLINQRLSTMPNPAVLDAIHRAVMAQGNLYEPHCTVLYLKGVSDREAVVYLASNQHLTDDDRQLIEVFCANISIGFENVTLFQKLNAVAYTDPLTGLANRARFIALLDEALEGEQRPSHCVALMDIDHFSEINDALGHANGDLLLKAIGQRLKETFGDAVLIARVGADTFGLLCPSGALDPQRIIDLFNSPFAVNAYFLRIKVSVGLAQLSETTGGGIGALKDVNIALNRAKQDQRGRFVWYAQAMASETRQRLTMLHDLRAVIEGQGMQLYYQPQIELSSGQVIGVEALLRWQLPNGQFVPPDRFIPLAEYSGLIIDLGEWVFRTACLQQLEWQQLGVGALRMAVNVSLSQFRHQGFVSMVKRALTELGVSPNMIELEVTESMAMHRIDEVRTVLRQLTALGITVAIDDFGTGFSSLSYLQRLDVNRLKIDRAFVNDLGRQSERASIPEMIVKLGQSLNLKVIAEGVETPEQADHLRELGCDEVQGYLYAKPMPADDFVRWFLMLPEGRVKQA